ncbi:MAG: diguanylate cyclase [Spirochaetes bacterium]|jgi:two-component system cell cycle response regulator|nr:diguanylate cyclase [Spirochaetota bacterium]
MDSSDKSSIMVVDDELTNLYLLENLLNDYKVTKAQNGEEMFRQIDDAAPQVIVLDVMLPGRNGFELASMLSADKRYSAIHIIFLTAKTESIDVAAGFKHGGYDYIKKPFDEIELLARVEAAVRRAREHERLESEVYLDALTQLYNRRYLEDYVKTESARILRTKENFAVAMIDLDNFKEINDTMGHPCGDYILSQFASVITKSLREYDVAVRYGGEEFLLVFPSESKSGAIMVLERIMTNNQSMQYRWEGAELSFDFTAGIADFSELPVTRMPLEDLITKADHRLYAGKQNGRNRIIVDD